MWAVIGLYVLQGPVKSSFFLIKNVLNTISKKKKRQAVGTDWMLTLSMVQVNHCRSSMSTHVPSEQGSGIVDKLSGFNS
jgi:hypothetical protein